MTDPANYLGLAPQMVDRVIASCARPETSLRPPDPARRGRPPGLTSHHDKRTAFRPDSRPGRARAHVRINRGNNDHRRSAHRHPHRLQKIKNRCGRTWVPDHRRHGAGSRIGFLFPGFAVQLKILGDIFLRLIKTAVAPLVFLCVAIGVVSAGDFKRVGKVGLVAMLYFEIVSSIALAFGLLAGNLLGVGQGMGAVAAGGGRREAADAAAGEPHSTLDYPEHLSGQFRGRFRAGRAAAGARDRPHLRRRAAAPETDKRLPIERGLNRISEAFFEFIHIIMWFAPLGTFGAVAYAVGSSGTACCCR